MVAAAPDGTGGWQLAVIRHGKLASAETAPRGNAPMPIVEELLARATTIRPEAIPGTAATAEETTLVAGWLERRGTRLVHCTQPWKHPAGGAGGWAQWLHRARQTARDEPTTPDGAHGAASSYDRS
jgi:DNA polymerase-3 subunit epsilon